MREPSSMQFLLRNGHILASLGMEKGKYGFIGCISGWFGSLKGPPSITDGGLRVSGYRLVRWKWERCRRCDFTTKWAHTSPSTYGQRKIWLSWMHFRLVWGSEGALRVIDGGLRVLGISAVWVGGNERNFLNAILQWNRRILATLGMERERCGYLWRISKTDGLTNRLTDRLIINQPTNIGCYLFPQLKVDNLCRICGIQIFKFAYMIKLFPFLAKKTAKNHLICILLSGNS